MTGKWEYPKVGKWDVHGRDLSEDNFAQEDRKELEILLREALQNPLDARAGDNKGPVRVAMRVVTTEGKARAFLDGLLLGEYLARFVEAGGVVPPEVDSGSALVIEDFGTIGLEGVWDDQGKDGSGENWNAFWFREGEGAKSGSSSNGRAGQGKITYYRAGAVRALFGLTIRKSDGKQLLMGRSAFRREYRFTGEKWKRYSFWSNPGAEPAPVTDEKDIAAFREHFKLARTCEPGLSLIIPYPIGFSRDEAIRAVLAEFYCPIAEGRLEVGVDGVSISAENLEGLADEYLTEQELQRRRSCFSKGFRSMVHSVLAARKAGAAPPQCKPGWNKGAALEDEFFPTGTVEELRRKLEDGEIVSVRFPLVVKSKSNGVRETWFDVHLQVPEELAQSEEAYIRRDLLIGGEAQLKGSSHLQRARALTLISDDSLSAFLADAEEPTHLKWNGSRPRLAEDYVAPSDTLRAVRQAAPRLLAFLSNSLSKRDKKALARYFNRPVDEGKKPSEGGTKTGGTSAPPEPPPTPPPPSRKAFRITTTKDTIQVLPNGPAELDPAELPIECVLEVAYEGLDLGDPFRAYDPFDFDLGDAGAHPIQIEGATVTERKDNCIRFTVEAPDFSLKVPGFDPNIRLKARLNYPEKPNGTAVSEE